MNLKQEINTTFKGLEDVLKNKKDFQEYKDLIFDLVENRTKSLEEEITSLNKKLNIKDKYHKIMIEQRDHIINSLRK